MHKSALSRGHTFYVCGTAWCHRGVIGANHPKPDNTNRGNWPDKSRPDTDWMVNGMLMSMSIYSCAQIIVRPGPGIYYDIPISITTHRKALIAFIAAICCWLNAALRGNFKRFASRTCTYTLSVALHLRWPPIFGKYNFIGLWRTQSGFSCRLSYCVRVFAY